MSDPVFDGYWAKVMETWDEDARHKAFVGYAAQMGRLDEAAVRYRSVVDAPIASDLPPPPDVAAELIASEATDAIPPLEPDPASDARAAREARRADAKRRLESVALAAVMMLDTQRSTDTSVDAKRFGRRLALIFLCVVMSVLAYLMAKMYGAI